MKVVSPFSWDIVVTGDKTLEFYDNGTLTHKKEIPEATKLYSVAYDPVHDRVLFCDHIDPNVSISSYDLTTKQIQHLLTKETDGFNRSTVDFDPVTQLLFLREGYTITSFSLNPEASKKARDGIRIVQLPMPHFCEDIAVDSYGGYIYWITDNEIERIRFDGSGRELLIRENVLFRLSLAIDLDAQKIYWIEDKEVLTPKTVQTADLRGQNRTTFYTIPDFSFPSSLAVTKDYIYWQDYERVGTWQLPKDPSNLVPRKLEGISSEICWACQRVATKYTLRELN
ncbi:hypothetical protein PYW08_012102 [Mythimna loreyi]|uniref:Uncharacterized protein n=1 Tax=Mythimna loreyi TaxID=667449 RepID=A0ACC2Q0H0_9NEOP|nr:hypothetical protein PYW08_012102 [Mythimna loreyi]